MAAGQVWKRIWGTVASEACARTWSAAQQCEAVELRLGFWPEA